MPGNRYDYFEHEADIGIIGIGDTVEVAFVQAARAVFAYMVDLESVRPQKKVEIQFTESDMEIALVEWLNHLLSKARQEGLIFSKFTLHRQHIPGMAKLLENPGGIL